MKLSNISGALLVIGLTSPDIPHAPDDIVCSTVVYYVSLYGEKEAERWARRHGWTRERIAEMRMCLVR